MARSIISRDIGLKKNRRRFSFNFSLVFTDRYEKEYLKQHYKSSSLLRPAALTRCFATTKIEAGKKAKFIPISPTVLRRDVAGVLEKRKSINKKNTKRC